MNRSLPVATVAGLLLAVLPAAAEAAPRWCGGERVTIVGTSGNDHLTGTRRADVIDGLAGSDVINGLQGDDIICGGYGADDLRGNAGRDRLYGGLDARVDHGEGYTAITGDTLRGGSGDDTLVPGIDSRTARSVSPDRILYDTAPGGVRVDLTQGTATGDGTDRIAVNGPVELLGTPYADTVVGSPYADTITTGTGRDTVRAAGGDDSVTTTLTAAKTLEGGTGTDDLRVLAGAGASGAILDIAAGDFRTDSATPVVATLADFETYAFRGSAWQVLGSDRADHVNARSMGLGQPVRMQGRGGDDTLIGGGGDDEFDGGLGQDCLQVSEFTGDNGTDSMTSVERRVEDSDPCPWP